MKIKILFAATVLAGLLCGCETVGKTLFRPSEFKTNDVPARVVSIQTNQIVTILQTNTVTVFQTNQVGATVTNQVVTVTETKKQEPVTLNVTIPAHQEVIPTAWVPNEATVGIANTVGGLAGPYGGIASTVFALALGAAAQFKSRQYRNAAISLAQGIQTTIESLPESEAKQVKNTQRAVQEDHGTRAVVKKLIASDVEARPKV